MEDLTLAAGDYALAVAPDCGGAIRWLDWRGQPLLRRATGPSVLDVACFALVPFSNRIACGRFNWEGRQIRISPNFPGTDYPHPLHGFGWVSRWTVTGCDPASVTMEHACSGGEWPWPYLARQTIALTGDSVSLTLAVSNLGDSPMPVGLGFHPYFPRTGQTLLHGYHLGECRNDADCLPQAITRGPAPVDWWHGRPVGSRCVDTVYLGRDGPLTISWAERNLMVRLECDPLLAHTAIFVPPGEDWFCAEPVSHLTNAVNRPLGEPAMPALAPGAELAVVMRLVAGPLRPPSASLP